MTIYYTRLPTPLFNTKEPSFVLDSQGRNMAIETVLPKSAPVSVILEGPLCQITTPLYPSSTPLYADKRLLQRENPGTTKKPLPSLQEILATLTKLTGVRYFWGGTHPEGIPELPALYDIPSTPDTRCEGVDCSGFLAHASRYNVPRNTSDLVNFGIEVAGSAKPLDLFVWRGHVLIAIDPETVIESRIGKGVCLSNLQQRLAEVQQPERRIFHRRWHPESLHS